MDCDNGCTPYKFAKINWAVYFKQVNFMLWKLNLSKFVYKIKYQNHFKTLKSVIDPVCKNLNFQASYQRQEVAFSSFH